MKIYSKEEEEEHYRIIIHSGLKSGIIALGISTLGSFILNKKWSKFRQLPFPIKSFFVSSIATTALVFATDNASRKYQDNKYGSPNSVEPVKELNWKNALLKWGSENKWKIIGGSWVLGMAGSISLLWKDKYLTKAQKLVQARMYAQGITLLILLISAGMSIDSNQIFVPNRNPKNITYDNKKESDDITLQIRFYKMKNIPGNMQRCEILGPFSLLVQGILGTLILFSLLIKRYWEFPRRSFKIWFFDVSKQIIGAGVVHILNVIISDVIGFNEKEKRFSNPCVWYLLNIMIDTTLGVPILWLALRTIGKICIFMGCHGTKSGDYDGDPPRIAWWWKQMLIYILCLIFMKISIIPILKIPVLDNIANWLLSWTISQEKLQIFFTMFLIPLIMNILQYWIIDTIIAKKQKHIVLESKKMNDRPLIVSK
ncbi:hypothetical protein PORY_000674 [Pneumocystis oryctolagi]|uniref:Uncharacterized protein n=1 Tax=Pneumocystis oryctolagi TaxID=42067 RepID=A0ACB7CIR8_9ASCO|nr:hypothetical protein PORY_000674 [Pneumocystis oryctolagi]